MNPTFVPQRALNRCVIYRRCLQRVLTYMHIQMVSVMRTFVLAMVLHPEVLAKAQEEMDRVIGSERLPDWDDREALTYLDCVIKEVYRYVDIGTVHHLH